MKWQHGASDQTASILPHFMSHQTTVNAHHLSLTMSYRSKKTRSLEFWSLYIATRSPILIESVESLKPGTGFLKKILNHPKEDLGILVAGLNYDDWSSEIEVSYGIRNT